MEGALSKKVRQIASAGAMDGLVSSLQKSFGQNSARKGGLQRALRSVPTGSLALDFELGTGGWPLGYLCGVFGPRDIGKSSMVGFNAIRNAQAMGLNCAYIAVEPAGSENWEAWATLNGVNVDELLLTWPETGEEAFEMLLKILRSEVVDFVVFDSIGAILGEGELKEDGKARQGGQSSLISWGVKAAAPLAFKNDVGVLLFNQVRHLMSPGVRGTVYKQPGGEALEHSEAIIVQLKRGKAKYTVKDNGNDVTIGGEIVADIRRNKLSQGTGKRAAFDYYHTQADGYPFGIDADSDVVNTAVRTGVIERAGSFYRLPDGTQHQGMTKVGEHMAANPEAFAQVREGVLQAMLARGQTANPKTLEEVQSDAG